MRKASLFIGSSVEGRDVAFALQELLEFDCDPTVWTQDVFRPGRTVMAELVATAERSDFAVLVFTPDDLVTMRGETTRVARDNVVFELGVFTGALGIDRVFYARPREGETLQAPSDLLGIEPLEYASKRDDGNLVAALGPAANRLRRAMRSAGVRSTVREPDQPLRLPALDDFTTRWDGPEFADTRTRLRHGVVMHLVEDETGEDTRAMQHAFSFFEALASAVLSGSIAEGEARLRFAASLQSFWRIAYTYLAPLNQADEWWEPWPALAVLASRWR